MAVHFHPSLRTARIVVLLVGLVAPAAARAGALDEARAALARGDYERVPGLAEQAEAGEEREAALVRARALELTGHEREALEILRREADAGSASPEAATALGRWLVERGEWEQAITVLDPVAEGEVAHLPATYWRALAFLRMGRESRARLDLEDFVRAWQRGRARTAEELLYVGMACHRLERYQDANDAFREALELDPSSQDIRLRWAELFMEKYRPDEAVDLLDEVIADNPHHPVALAMRGRAALDLTYDIAEARRLSEAALVVRADAPEALEVLASIAIDDRDYDRALELLSTVHEDRPRRVETIGLIGAVHYLTDDHDAFARDEALAREVDPRPAWFYFTVGQFAERNFRYEEALDLHRRSVELDAGFWPAFVSLGIGFSRAGDDARALQFLRRAFEADPFNVQAYNMVELWERTLSEYRYVDDPSLDGVRYRFHRDELPVLERYVPPVVRATWAKYVERFGFEPDMPLSVEIFADEPTFGIRSVGLPFVGLHGICFGHVVTARSPGEGNFNWRQVIEHEMSHVFSLARSRAHVPRWFTEGLAEYDTMLSRSEWRREEDLAVIRALQRDGLTGVLELNRAFVAGDRPDRVLEAYFQSSLVVEFIGERWGYDAVIAMLDAWAASMRTEQVFQTALGVTPAEFDELFEDRMRARYASMLGLFEPALWWFGDLDAARARAAEWPDDASAAADLAWALLAAEELDTAQDTLDAALALDPRQPMANLLAGHIAWDAARFGDARRHYEAVIASGADSYTAHAALAELAAREGDPEEARDELLLANELFANDADVVARLAELAKARGDDAAAVRWQLRLAELDEHDADTALQLADRFLVSGDVERALRYAERAANVDPFAPRLHPLFGRAAAAVGRWDIARRELELALETGAGDRRQLATTLVDVYEHLGLADDAARVRRDFLD